MQMFPKESRYFDFQSIDLASNTSTCCLCWEETFHNDRYTRWLHCPRHVQRASVEKKQNHWGSSNCKYMQNVCRAPLLIVLGTQRIICLFILGSLLKCGIPFSFSTLPKTRARCSCDLGYFSISLWGNLWQSLAIDNNLQLHLQLAATTPAADQGVGCLPYPIPPFQC